MKSKFKLLPSSRKTSKAAHVALAALLFAAADLNAATVILLSADTANSETAAFGSSLAGTVTDGFSYDPLNPTSALPDQNFNGSDGFHGNLSSGTHTLSYMLTGGTFTVTVGEPTIVLDFYGRDPNGTLTRDNNYTVTLYNGNYTTLVGLPITGQGVPDSAPYFNRTSFILAPGTQFDRLQITAPASAGDPGQYFSVMEVRLAAIPEPSAALLGGLGLLGLLRRRRV